MGIIEIIVLVIAYSVGIVTLFLELICYRRNIEYPETIFLTASFLALITSISVTSFMGYGLEPNAANRPSLFILLSMVLLALATPLNVFAERQFKPNPMFKKGLVVGAILLFVTVITSKFLGFYFMMENIVTGALLVSIIYSMLLIRTTKPVARVAHREKIERITAGICMVILPITLVIDFFPDALKIPVSVQSKIGLTLPLFFIFIAGGKLLDDIKRLSLFKPENKIKSQHIQNYQFTPRELEVAQLILKGHTYHQIGEALFISLPTVKTHVSNVYKKAKVNNKIELLNLLMVN